MSVLHSFWQYRRAYWLAFVAYWGIVLFGYDTGVGGGVVTQKFFISEFGLSGSKQRQADLSSNVVAVLQAGAFFGALGSAPISARIGRKYTLLAFSLLFAVGAALQTAASPSLGLGTIYAGRIISGIGIGAISAVAPAYVSECAPKEHRGRITGLFQIMVAIGVMLSYFINFGVSLHMAHDARVWRVPFGFQLVPCGVMCLGLLFVRESPRWLASKGRMEEAIVNLAYYRDLDVDSDYVRSEFAEIEAALDEERRAREGLGWKEAFIGKGNWPRFLIAFVIFMLQQWCGQNSVSYYAPTIFASIGYSGTSQSLLASGIYGICKVVATAIFIFSLSDSFGRRPSLMLSAFGMGTLFFIIGALLKTFPPDPHAATPATASKAMAAMLYIYVCFYSLGWGPLPWVYVSDIFPTRTRHYGLALASASQWLWNFVVTKVTPTIQLNLGYKMFFLFASINIGAMLVFAFFLPETKGRSLEEMDVIFGAADAATRRADIEKNERELAHGETASSRSDNLDEKV